MDKVLRPERFDVSPSSTETTKCWRHWLITFENYIASLPSEGLNKLHVLINHVSPEVYDLFCEVQEYDDAIETLKSLYVRTPNEVFARHKLATRKQESGETLDEYLQVLKTLSKDCNFRSVSAAKYRDESIRDAFISGISSCGIRQRLLENKSLDLQTAFDQARALDIAQKSSEMYNSGNSYILRLLPQLHFQKKILISQKCLQLQLFLVHPSVSSVEINLTHARCVQQEMQYVINARRRDITKESVDQPHQLGHKLQH